MPEACWKACGVMQAQPDLGAMITSTLPSATKTLQDAASSHACAHTHACMRSSYSS